MKHKQFFCFLAVFMLLAVFVPPAAAVVEAAPVHIAPDAEYVPGEVIVGFADDASAAAVQSRASAMAGEVSAEVVRVSGRIVLLRAEGADVAALTQSLAAQPGVAFAEPNYIVSIPPGEENAQTEELEEAAYTVKVKGEEKRMTISELRAQGMAQAFPTDRYYSQAFEEINASIIWNNTAASPTVCVIDTGVDALHPDLYGKVVNGKNFVEPGTLPRDENGHGTHVAGIIAAKANNNIGITGISNGKVLAVKALDASGNGSMINVVEAIRYCNSQSSVKVINLSLGSYEASAAMYSILQESARKNKLVVAAAGNGSTSDYLYPAAWSDAATPTPWTGDPQAVYPSLISVGAQVDRYNIDYWVDENNNNVVDPDTEIVYSDYACAAHFSNYGAWVSVIAAGENITSTIPVSNPSWSAINTSGYQSKSGTSMATPAVAAAAARGWSVYTTAGAVQMKQYILSTGTRLDEIYYGTLPEDQDTGVNPTWGFWQSDYGADYYYDADMNEYYAYKAPFCWPVRGTGRFAAQAMADTVIVDVARLMGRAAVSGYVDSANSGMPIPGSSVRLMNKANNTVVGSAVTSKPYGYYNINNIKIPGFNPLAPYDAGLEYKVQAYRSGFTSTYTTVDEGYAEGGWWSGVDEIALAPVTNGISIVLRYYPWESEIHPYLFLPPTSQGVIGGAYGLGTPTNFFYDSGSLALHPYAYYFGSTSSWPWPSIETIAIAKKPYTSLPRYSGDYVYEVFAPWGGEINNYMRVTVWSGGKIIADSGHVGFYCGSGQNWMRIFKLNGSTVTWLWECGYGSANAGAGGVWPYSVSGMSVNGQ